MDQEQLTIPEGWKKAAYAEPGADTGKQEKNLELITPGPIGKGEDDYHSKYVDPEGPFGAAKVGDADDSYGGEGGEAQEKPEGVVPMVPQGWGLQAPPYPARHKGVASSY
jgi:hypothetical protein